MIGKEQGCDLFYEVIHEMWGHLLPKVKVKSLSCPSLVIDDDEVVNSEGRMVKSEDSKMKSEVKSEGSGGRLQRSNTRALESDQVQEVVVISDKASGDKQERKPRRRMKIVKIQIDDSDDEAQEKEEYAALVRETGGPATIAEIEMRLNYLRRAHAFFFIKGVW